MRRVGPKLAAAMLVGGVLASLLAAEEDRSVTATSFGTIPRGHGAAYELLASLSSGVARSYAAPDRLEPAMPLWWVAPYDLCVTGEGSARRRSFVPCFDPAPFLAAGGTGVLFLPEPRDAQAGVTVAGAALPRVAPRAEAAGEGEAAAHQGEAEAACDAGPIEEADAAALEQRVSGALAAEGLLLDQPPLRAFVAPDPAWTVVAEVEGRPFVLERALGAGHLVLVADAAFLENEWLARGDAAPLAVALARRYGAPAFDERQHGLGPERSAIGYLARSAAMPLLAGTVLLGALFAWHGAAVPPRGAAPEAPGPTVVAFVEALARLYATSRRHAEILARYREVTAARLRRHFGLGPETSLEALVARLACRRGLDAGALTLLEHGTEVATDAQLARAVAVLDRLTMEAAR